MRKPLLYALRFLVIVAVVMVLFPLVQRSAPTGTPYVSALSDFTAGPVLAAGCQNKRCTSNGVKGNAKCVTNAGTNCNVVRLGGGLARCDPDTTC